MVECYISMNTPHSANYSGCTGIPF